MSNQKIVIAGSRICNEKMVEYTKKVVISTDPLKHQIIVGDNHRGVDSIVNSLCSELKKELTIVGITPAPRNGGNIYSKYIRVSSQVLAGARSPKAKYTARDRYMIDQADIGIFIWNGTSSGTKAGYDYMISQGKKAYLISF